MKAEDLTQHLRYCSETVTKEAKRLRDGEVVGTNQHVHVSTVLMDVAKRLRAIAEHVAEGEPKDPS